MIAGFLQARVGSQRCVNKMLRNFAGTNLITLALEKYTVEPRSFDLYYAAHEDALLEVGKKFDCQVITRDERSAKGERIEDVMNFLAAIPTEYVMFINACHVFLTLDTLEKAVAEFERSGATSMTSVVRKKTWYYFLDGRPVNLMDPTNVNTKLTPELWEVAHAFHIFPKQRLLDKHYYWSHQPKDPVFFEIPEKEATDIDTELDFQKAEALFLYDRERRIVQ